MFPLAGIRIVDFTEGAQGPFAASLLGDLGAEVVKVERPGGELMRRMGPYAGGQALPVLTISRSRAAVVTLDLKNPADREAVFGLVGAADLLIQNWRIGSDERVGLDYAAVKAVNPNLVYVRASSYGSRGDLAGEGSMDSLSQSAGGMASLSGPVGGPPERIRTPLLDFVSSFVAAEAAMIGLLARARTGRGCLVDTSQLSAALDLLGPELALARGGELGPCGSSSRHVPFGRICRTADGVELAIECQDEAKAALLAQVLGLAPDAVGGAADIIAGMSHAAVEERLKAARVPCARVERPFAFEHLERFFGATKRIEDPCAGEIRMPEAPWIFSLTPVTSGLPLGPVGRDNPWLPDMLERWRRDMAAEPANSAGRAAAGS